MRGMGDLCGQVVFTDRRAIGITRAKYSPGNIELLVKEVQVFPTLLYRAVLPRQSARSICKKYYDSHVYA